MVAECNFVAAEFLGLAVKVAAPHAGAEVAGRLITVVGNIKDVRLKKAAALLKRYPNITIGQLAAKVGFATPKYLSKCFKTKFGVLPSQYTQNRAPD